MPRFGTNINFLLEEYGIMVNSDAVVRTNYYKYFHPKVSSLLTKCFVEFLLYSKPTLSVSL